MAASGQLISWLLIHAKDLALEVVNLPWIRQVYPDLYDLRATIEIDGRKHFGFGWGEDRDLALQKAFAEAAERAVCTENRFSTTNGFAAHLDVARARHAAENELYERDQFLSQFYAGIPFAPWLLPGTATADLDPVRKVLEPFGVSLKFYHLGGEGVLCALDGLNASVRFGFIFGAARKETLTESLRSATIEATRQFFLFMEKSSQSLSLSEFLDLEKPDFGNHGDLALNPEYADKIRPLFTSAGAGSVGPDAAGIVSTSVKPIGPLLLDCPLVFARASSPAVQDLFLGAPTPERMNLRRLSQFAGRELKFADLNLLPHPFN